MMHWSWVGPMMRANPIASQHLLGPDKGFRSTWLSAQSRPLMRGPEEGG